MGARDGREPGIVRVRKQRTGAAAGQMDLSPGSYSVHLTPPASLSLADKARVKSASSEGEM